MITMVNLVTVCDHSKTLLLLILFPILYISYSWFILQLEVFTSCSPSPISFLPPSLIPSGSYLIILCIYNSVCLFIYFVFLYSTYKWNTVFLWLISLSTTEIGSSMVLQMAVFHYLMCLSNIPLCVCLCVSMCLYTHRSHIYPFIFWCAVWLLPYLGNCK